MAVIEEIEERNLLERAEGLGRKAKIRLGRMKRRYEPIGDVRGLGLMLGVDLVKDRGTKERAYDEAKKVVWRAYELGLIVAFLRGNILRIQPPLTIEEELLEDGLERLEVAIEDVEDGKVPDEVVEKVQWW